MTKVTIEQGVLDEFEAMIRRPSVGGEIWTYDEDHLPFRQWCEELERQGRMRRETDPDRPKEIRFVLC